MAEDPSGREAGACQVYSLLAGTELGGKCWVVVSIAWHHAEDVSAILEHSPVECSLMFAYRGLQEY